MEKLNRQNAGLENTFPIKVVQFGEGNFLRAFVDYAFQELNKNAGLNAGIAVVQPLQNGMINMINTQDGLYTLFMNGIKKGERIQEIELINNIVKGINPYTEYDSFLALAKEEELQFIISNTTEAGIEYIDTDTPDMRPPVAFPARLTVLLYERFMHFNGDSTKGVTIIPCELINFNADTLKEIIFKYSDLWNLDKGFNTWLTESCSFHNTLVDRIVPGYPRNEIEEYNSKLAYKDDLIVTAEPFFLWVIEGDEALKQKLPFHKTNVNVKIVDDMQPFRTLKVRILNGAHTAMVPFSLLYGNETVKQTVDGDFTGKFVDRVINEISGTLPMDENEVKEYAEEVMDRFRNPFIKHLLSDIALNSVSKFKVRVLPSLLQYYKNNNELPTELVFSLACLIRFYKGTWNGNTLPVKDSPDVVAEFDKAWATGDINHVVNSVLSNTDFWGEDLTLVEGVGAQLVAALSEIENNGVEAAYKNFSKEYQA
ncbi:tagaturonate reductase [Flavobacterium sp. RHBU_3]|uniref:tagaturonate reductase n=1 Tax=Flavobacterium sp. RHBU_3 TaxID=3391184 RepID=UPI0039847A51